MLAARCACAEARAAARLLLEHQRLLWPFVCRFEAPATVVNSNAESSAALRHSGWGPQSLLTLALFVFVNAFSLGLPLRYALNKEPYWAGDLPAGATLSNIDV